MKSFIVSVALILAMGYSVAAETVYPVQQSVDRRKNPFSTPATSLSPSDIEKLKAAEAAAGKSIKGKLTPGAATASTPKPVEEEEVQAKGKKAGKAEKTVLAKPEETEPEELSAIEKTFLLEQEGPGESKPQVFASQPLMQFGYSFFKDDSVGFAPLVDVPVAPEYPLGPGDRIVLTTWGSIDGTFELEVNRSGEIILPKVGAVKVNGVPFGQLASVIRTNLGKVYKDFQVNVTMGKLRLIKVYIVGQVKSPGDYSINSLSTVINALTAAGGPTKNGSLRNIQIKRGGRVVEAVDLYEFFLKGDKSGDIRLQPGDTIHVPVIGPVAGIAGNVRRPAFYELKGEKTLRDLLSLADGIIPTGFLQRIQASRVQPHEKRTVVDYALTEGAGKQVEDIAANIPVQDQDIFRIFQIDQRQRGYVRLEGHVLRPGDYALTPGMKVSDVLKTDGLLFEFYEKAAEITRLMPPDYHPEKIIFNPSEALAGKPENNVELKEFDTIRIFSRWELEEQPKVRIGGEIQKPGEYRLYDNMSVRDLVLAAGNPKQNAYLKNAEINRLKKDGESVTAYSIFINLGEALKGNPEDNITLAPFDEVIIRTIPNWAEETDRYITLKGEVKFPGIYPVYRGERLSSVIERAGGFTERAYLRGAKFTRESIRQDQQQRMDEMLARMEQEVLRKQTAMASVAASKEELESSKAALEGLQRQIASLKDKKAEGRLVIQLAPIKKMKNGTYDIEVLGGDTLSIPQTPHSVNIMGQVYNPTTVIHIPGQQVSYYINKSGGATKDADEDDMYIIRADGTVLSKQQTSSFLFYDGFLTSKVDPGDTVVVPQQFEKTAWMRDIKDIATILGQIALTAGVIVAAGL